MITSSATPATLADVPKDATFLLRLSADELAAWRAAADAAGLKLSEWVRRRCNGVQRIEAQTIEPPPPPKAKRARSRKRGKS